MDWSFAGRAGAAPAVMSFRSAAREEQQGELAYPKQQASRVLTSQVTGAAAALDLCTVHVLPASFVD